MQIHLQSLRCHGTKRNNPFPRSVFAIDIFHLQIYIGNLKRYQFWNADPRSIKQLHHCPVPKTFGGIAFCLRQQSKRFIFCQNGRRLFLHPGRFQFLSDILLDTSHFQQILKKSFQRRNVPRNCCRLSALFFQKQNIRIQSCDGYLIRFFYSLVRKILIHFPQIPLIRYRCIFRGLANLFHVLDKS